MLLIESTSWSFFKQIITHRHCSEQDHVGTSFNKTITKLPNKVWKLGAPGHDLCGTMAKPYGKYYFAWLHPREGRHLCSWPKTWKLAPCSLDGLKWPPIRVISQFENNNTSAILPITNILAYNASVIFFMFHAHRFDTFYVPCCENFRQHKQARVMKAWHNPCHIMIHLRHLPRKFEFGSGNDVTFE